MTDIKRKVYMAAMTQEFPYPNDITQIENATGDQKPANI
jgi:hypothetical protein